MDKPKAIFSRKFLRKPRCDAIRCVALRVPDVVGVELGNPIKKFNRQSLLYSLYLFARYSYLSHSLTLSLCIYLSLSLSLSHALYSYVGAVQMAAGLWIMHSNPGELLRSKLKIIRFFFLFFFFFAQYCYLTLSLSLHLKGLWLLWGLGWSVGMAALRSTRRVPYIRTARFAFISAHKMHNSQISI